MKGKLLSYLRHHWIPYSVYFVIAILVTSISATYLGRTKDNEKIDIFLVTENFEREKFAKKLDEVKPDYLKELNYRYVSPNDNAFTSILGTYGVVQADLFFLRESTVKTIECSALMLPLDTEIIEKTYAKSLSYYEDESEIYGIALNKEYFNDEETIYACFNKDSLHLGEWKSEELNGDIEVVRAFL